MENDLCDYCNNAHSAYDETTQYAYGMMNGIKTFKDVRRKLCYECLKNKYRKKKKPMENGLCCRCKKNQYSVDLPFIKGDLFGGVFNNNAKPVFSVDKICIECYKKQTEEQKEPMTNKLYLNELCKKCNSKLESMKVHGTHLIVCNQCFTVVREDPMPNKLTPLDIRILLHYYTTTGIPYPNNEFDAVINAQNNFVSLGLLNACPGINGEITLSEGGKLLVEALCKTPIPVQKWVIPGKAV